MTTILDRDALIARHRSLFPGDAASPPVRIRERARRLDVAEVHLVAAGLGVAATPLHCQPQEIFSALSALGNVMALTRNDDCVHERHGRYEQVRTDGGVGLVLGPDIDLRLFFDHWRHAFEVEENGRSSLQFFGDDGDAVHKIYRTGQTDEAAWRSLVRRFEMVPTTWPPGGPVTRAPAAASVRRRSPDSCAVPPVSSALRERWLALRDTHAFHPMLRALSLSRLAALEQAGADLAQQVPVEAVEHVLQSAANRSLPIMCFVGNRGAIQIHTGSIQHLKRTGPWFNVLDPMFNLHLDTTAIASCWVVNKPSDDGWITSLEAFDDDGALIVQFFGARKPGVPELREWRSLLTLLCREPLRD